MSETDIAPEPIKKLQRLVVEVDPEKYSQLRARLMLQKPRATVTSWLRSKIDEELLKKFLAG
jgi:hypothetical protein